MNTNHTTQTPIRCLMAVFLTAFCAVTTARAAGPALQGQLLLRPLTPQDIKDYSLTGLQGASGLNTVGVGQPAYLEVLVNNAVTNSDITNVTWTLTAKPVGSSAALAASPLGTNVPTFRMADRFNNNGAPVYKVPTFGGAPVRRVLRPDTVGQYTVTVTVQTASSGSTNLTQNITAGTYVGINTCALCHSGGVLAEDKYHPWSQTPHATKFAREIDGGTDPATTHYNKNCISCHTVGYDTNTNAVNGGFDDIAAQLHWTFPTNLVPGNWASMQTNYPDLANLANIQCENCHGPGSEHAGALGKTNVFNWPRIAVTYDVGNCGQCHDSKNNHYRNAEWNNSKHAVATRVPSGPARAACARCHTGGGFAQYAATLGTTNVYTTNHADTVYTAITCATCHDPHDDSNPHQLRAGETVTLGDGTTVTNAGAGALCMNCHQSRNGSVTNSIVKYPLGQQTWAGGSAFGVHDNCAADMLEGVNGWTYGLDIPSSAHRNSVADTCVGCHMQPVTSSDPAFTKAGGHTWNMTYNVVTNGTTNVVDMVGVCVQCHGPIQSFDMVKVDYNGDGVIEGVQTEVQKLLDKLSTMLPGSAYVADGNYVADGLVKTSVSVKTNWPAKFLKAAYNWQFVNNDLSKGVHNTAYAVGLLKASIGDLTGDSNNDGLPDSWQMAYFGSVNAPNAAPNASPAGDGIPNWLKYALGLNPLIAGLVVPDGVVWANASSIGGGTNTIHIYTAAEIVFDTEVGKTYQIQAVSNLGQGWQNIGSPIPGTGQAISYVTPTRSNAQQFYRVVHTP
jgi:hypothetical protein